MSVIDDLFRRFNRIAIQQGFSPFDRVLFYTLVYLFDSRYWVDELALSQMELTQWTGLKKSALDEAKHGLSSRHIIEISKKRREQIFRFGADWQPKVTEKNDRINSQPLKNGVATSSVEGVKDERQNSGSITSTNADQSPQKVSPSRAHAINNDLYIKDFEKKSSIDHQSINQSIDDRARESDSDRAERLWQELGGGRLSFEHLSKLEIYLKAHGIAWVEDAMREASDSNNNPRGIPPKFLFAIFEHRAQAGKKSERREQMREVEAEYYVAAETKNDLIDYKKYLKGV